MANLHPKPLINLIDSSHGKSVQTNHMDRQLYILGITDYKNRLKQKQLYFDNLVIEDSPSIRCHLTWIY